MRFKGNSGNPSARPRRLRPGPTIDAGRMVAASPARKTVPIALKFLEIEPRPRYARRRGQRLLGRAPPATGRAAERERDRRSLLHLESLGGDPDQGLLAQKFEPLQALVVGDQREIERACGDLRSKVGRRLANDRDLDQRMTAIEARQDVGQERFRVVVRNAEPSRAPQALARQRGERARLDLDNAAGEFDQLLALFGQPRAASLLDEQGAAQLLLEPADMHRDGGLGLVHPLGRFGERAGIDDGEKRAKLVGVEHGTHPKF